MLYPPVYAHTGDAQHAHAVAFPDFAGCLAAADDWSALPAASQEAAQAHFHGEPNAEPPPTPLEALAGGTPGQPGRQAGPHGLGSLTGQFNIPEDFDAALPQDMLALFQTQLGGGQGQTAGASVAVPQATRRTGKVAKR